MTGRERAMGAVTIALLVAGIATAAVKSGSNTTAAPPFTSTPTPTVSIEASTPAPTPTPTVSIPKSGGTGSTAKPAPRPRRHPSSGGEGSGSMPNTGVPSERFGFVLILAAIALAFGARRIRTNR
jgi:hypothetical protein